MGTMDSAPSWTNSALIQDSMLYPYVKNIGAYKCPADRMTTRDPFGLRAGGIPTVRSVAMNAWLNPLPNQSWGPDSPNGNPPRRNFRKISDIFKAAATWVVQDENPLSINDGWFVVDPSSQRWTDPPATYHNGANGLAFADGHSETKRWADPAVLRFNADIGSPPRDGGKDLQWLKDRTTY